jgi:hypothetical protein
MTPIRVVCQNTLNLALSSAKRVWSAEHTGSVEGKLQEARETLQLADWYMSALGDDLEKLQTISLSEKQVNLFTELLLPLPRLPPYVSAEMWPMPEVILKSGIMTRRI